MVQLLFLSTEQQSSCSSLQTSWFPPSAVILSLSLSLSLSVRKKGKDLPADLTRLHDTASTSLAGYAWPIVEKWEAAEVPEKPR